MQKTKNQKTKKMDAVTYVVEMIKHNAKKNGGRVSQKAIVKHMHKTGRKWDDDPMKTAKAMFDAGIKIWRRSYTKWNRRTQAFDHVVRGRWYSIADIDGTDPKSIAKRGVIDQPDHTWIFDPNGGHIPNIINDTHDEAHRPTFDFVVP